MTVEDRVRPAAHWPTGPAARATEPGPVPLAATWRTRLGRRVWPVLVPLGVALLALACRLVPVITGAGLFGRDGYDPYVYYSAAVAAFTGHVPYRDFLLLHPPGILVALQPFALVGAVLGDPVGMAAARVGFMLIGVTSCLLVYRLLLRSGRASAVVGATAYAVWRPAVYVERDVRLEAVAGVMVLLGMFVLQRAWRSARATRWAPAGAGALFAFASVVKIWGVVPLAVLAVWLLIERGWRAAARCALGAGAVLVVMFGPLTIVAPQWFQMVVLDQLGRNRAPVDVTRLSELAGMPGLSGKPVAVALVAVASVMLGAAIVTTLTDRNARLAAVLTLAILATLLASPSWFPHYPAFVAGPLCLVVGTAAGTLFRRLRAARLRRAASLALVAAIALAGVVLLPRGGVPFDGPGVAEILAGRSGCVTTDTAATLVLSDTLRRNFANGCPVVIDFTGLSYQPTTDRTGPDRRHNRAFQTAAMTYLSSGHSAILIRTVPDGLTRHNLRIIAGWPIIGRAGDVVVRQPT